MALAEIEVVVGIAVIEGRLARPVVDTQHVEAKPDAGHGEEMFEAFLHHGLPFAVGGVHLHVISA